MWCGLNALAAIYMFDGNKHRLLPMAHAITGTMLLYFALLEPLAVRAHRIGNTVNLVLSVVGGGFLTYMGYEDASSEGAKFAWAYVGFSLWLSIPILILASYRLRSWWTTPLPDDQGAQMGQHTDSTEPIG